MGPPEVENFENSWRLGEMNAWTEMARNLGMYKGAPAFLSTLSPHDNGTSPPPSVSAISYKTRHSPDCSSHAPPPPGGGENKPPFLNMVIKCSWIRPMYVVKSMSTGNTEMSLNPSPSVSSKRPLCGPPRTLLIGLFAHINAGNIRNPRHALQQQGRQLQSM